MHTQDARELITMLTDVIEILALAWARLNTLPQSKARDIAMDDILDAIPDSELESFLTITNLDYSI
jgi:hypothetical protein